MSDPYQPLTEADRLMRLETQMGDVHNDIAEMKAKLLGRPTWGITFALSAMVMLIGILGTLCAALVTR